MGATGSTLIGKALVHPLALPISSWTQEDVDSALKRFRKHCRIDFALTKEKFLMVLGDDFDGDGEALFDLYDDDQNGLVDAYELLSSACMASQMSIQARQRCKHAC